MKSDSTFLILKEKLKIAKRQGLGQYSHLKSTAPPPPSHNKPNEEKILSTKPQDSEDSNDSRNLGIRAGSELIVGMIAGGLIGYGLDHWLNTKPAFFLIFLILGVGVGFLNIYKLSQNIGTSVGFSELHKREKMTNTKHHDDKDPSE